MKRPVFWLILGAIGLLAAAAGYRLGVSGKSPETAAVAPAASAPAIFQLVLSDLKGQPQGIEQWRGKILVVNYWATWCPPCREEMPGFARLQEKFAARGVQFVGISIDTATKVTEFQQETPVNYPLLIGDMSAIDSSIALGNLNQGLPFTAVIDRQGVVSAVKLGRFAEADLERQLVELVSRHRHGIPPAAPVPKT